jgi:hypothetical protein
MSIDNSELKMYLRILVSHYSIEYESIQYSTRKQARDNLKTLLRTNTSYVKSVNRRNLDVNANNN